MNQLALQDTETTGRMAFGQTITNYTHPNAPYLVELAVKRIDPAGHETGRMHRIIRPEGWTIPADVVAIHGITTERAMDEGVPLREVMEEYRELLVPCAHAVAYNGTFDNMVMRVAMHRSGVDTRLAELELIDPMKFMTDLCRMPKATGKGYKYPKLIDAHHWAFQAGFSGAHGAMNDVEAMYRVFMYGREFVPHLAYYNPGGLTLRRYMR